MKFSGGAGEFAHHEREGSIFQRPAKGGGVQFSFFWGGHGLPLTFKAADYLINCA